MQLYFENGWPVSGVAMLTPGLRTSYASYSSALEQLAARTEMLTKCPLRSRTCRCARPFNSACEPDFAATAEQRHNHVRAQEPNGRQLAWLLRPRRQRPRCRRPAKQRDELASSHVLPSSRGSQPTTSSKKPCLCITACWPTGLPQRVIHVGLIHPTNSWHVRCTSDSSRISALQRFDEKCHKRTHAVQQKNHVIGAAKQWVES
jgi:hypothetical protein